MKIEQFKGLIFIFPLVCIRNGRYDRDVEGRGRESETIFTASAIPCSVVKKRGRKGEIKI
jgi:hypothetical protein